MSKGIRYSGEFKQEGEKEYLINYKLLASFSIRRKAYKTIVLRSDTHYITELKR